MSKIIATTFVFLGITLGFVLPANAQWFNNNPYGGWNTYQPAPCCLNYTWHSGYDTYGPFYGGYQSYGGWGNWGQPSYGWGNPGWGGYGRNRGGFLNLGLGLGFNW